MRTLATVQTEHSSTGQDAGVSGACQETRLAVGVDMVPSEAREATGDSWVHPGLRGLAW